MLTCIALRTLLQQGPHPSCSTPQCDAIWGAAGCPDLNAFKPDLVRPPMESGIAPAAGKRVRAVAPGFEGTLAYHPLYLPSEWTPPTNTGGDQDRRTNLEAAVRNGAGARSRSSAAATAASTDGKKYPVIVEYMKIRKMLPAGAENLLEDTCGLLRRPFKGGGGATHLSDLSGAVAGCARFLLTCALLMTSSHSKIHGEWTFQRQGWRC